MTALVKVSYGSRGSSVAALQQRLTHLGFNTFPDGVFGKGTLESIRKFQKAVGLTADGIVGDKTLTMLNTTTEIKVPTPGTVVDSKPVFVPSNVPTDIPNLESAALELDVDINVIKAVAKVESSGKGFFKDGTPAKLFERHWMYRLLKQKGLDYLKYSKLVPSIVNRKSGNYAGYEDENIRLELAMVLDKESALESCSWGAYQIMGFHWRKLGFDSVQSLVDLNTDSNQGQLDTFIKFIKSDPVLLHSLRIKDFTAFAMRYNGPHYNRVIPPYDVRIEKAYNAIVSAAPKP